MNEDENDGYPPVSDHFKLLATAAILVGTHPIDIFDAVDDVQPNPNAMRRKIEIIEEWKRERHKFAWYFDLQFWDEVVVLLKRDLGAIERE
jgi:hypothetical protein